MIAKKNKGITLYFKDKERLEIIKKMPIGAKLSPYLVAVIKKAIGIK